MKLWNIRASASLFFLILASSFTTTASQSVEEKLAILLHIEGPIGPATSDYVHRGLGKARDSAAKLVILQIDTPGGLDLAMRDIIQDVLASPIPVASYVAPSGARAASAGTYIIYASHVAAMAPGTNLGAATPVQIGGSPKPGSLPQRTEPGKRKGDENEKDAAPARPPATMTDKIVSDAVAYIRSLAQLRGRNAEWAEKAVREAASLSAEDALEIGVIDLVAATTEDLLAELDGREVTVLGDSWRLRTANLRVVAVEPDWRTQLLAVITNPNIAYLLMLLGIYGIIFEFYSPGLFVPGIVGVISLLLALYAFQVLPVNYAGLALILVGIALMVSEAFVPSFGALGIGGTAAFVIGSVMLLDIDAPGFGISWMLIGSIALVSAGFFMFVMTMLLRSRRRAVSTGPEEIIGSTGDVIEWDHHEGRVRVHGEIWQARSDRSMRPGRPVRVIALEGLTLVVQPEQKRRPSL